MNVGYGQANNITSGIVQQCHMMHRTRLNRIQSGVDATFLPKKQKNETPKKTTLLAPNSFQNMAKRADEIRENRVLVNKMVELTFNPSK